MKTKLEREVSYKKLLLYDLLHVFLAKEHHNPEYHHRARKEKNALLKKIFLKIAVTQEE
jgi:hypothetical protein